MIAEIKTWLARVFTPSNTRHQQDHYAAINQMIAFQQAIWHKTKHDQIDKLNEEIKSLQLSIAVAKKKKKKTRHFYAEMARLQAEVLRLESM